MKRYILADFRFLCNLFQVFVDESILRGDSGIECLAHIRRDCLLVGSGHIFCIRSSIVEQREDVIIGGLASGRK